MINNAGIWLGKEIHDVTLDEYHKLISINLTGVFLGTKYLRITNLNNNRQVIVEIDARNSIEDTLLISEATRRALLIDNGSLGSFSLEIIPQENNTLGVVRR